MPNWAWEQAEHVRRTRRPRRSAALALALALLLLALSIVAACGRAKRPIVGVTGTWVSLAQASPVANLPSPFAVFSPSPAASPRTSPAATRGTPLPASPQPDHRVTAVLAQSVGPDGRPVNPTTTFSPSADKIYLAFEARGLPANTHLEAVWIADQVDAPVPAGYEVTRSTIEVQGDQVGNFALSKPNPGFPTGQYHVDLYLDGTRIGSYPFNVK